ncbi:glycerophosphodiester phosphodiesterase [Diaphorobacter sp. J5-51]|uniref:glycerophosphodiester phosphodiesterase n=1 Tax=Diaphorobacter sp. J5-51 TaxID=680496 RepID=UPI0006437805|nr:glycerophosphodiester phosphodiesterase [Diaphorobacter sp. J5-51]KLR59504.1 glycerophosphodiester phosphodiesterase [Diaphorobacter sp. J5-51]
MTATSALAKLVLATSAALSLAASGGDGVPAWPPERAVIAHRGASALRPEHTLAAYQKAIDDGADLIEPDLVITKDGVLVARHENAIAILNADGTVREATTNVMERPEFADRKTTKVIDGKSITGWFTEDFTLAELKTLRARERIPAARPANTAYNDQFEVPTLQEVIDLVKAQSAARGRTIGIEPETKHPTYFQSIGLPLEPPLLATLEKNGWNHKAAPVIVQSFEVGNLKAIHQRSNVRLAQLVGNGRPYDFVAQGASNTRSYADLVTPAGLKEIATYAYAVAPHKELIIPLVRDARRVATGLGQPTSLVRDAHAAGLKVQAWTFRPENRFLPASLKGQPDSDATARGDSVAEIQAYLQTGVDGVFTDDAAVGRRAVDGLQP